ncbi:MAG: hypothetical protein A7315_00125 [Candidatus Altiarchaeales archaeon WOR_SM1_79]|nr:MAG: hypothetical protein A7315_00125 [Candidatus Altiarchaeales archaeon WOR_SM1_79]
MNKMIPLREKLINAIESKKKITKREFYAYEDVEHVSDSIGYFIDYEYHGDDEDEMYETLVKFADPIAEELSKIRQDRMIKKRIIKFISTLDTGLDGRDIRHLADEITDGELHRRKHCRACPDRCLFDPDGDATKMFIDSSPDLRGLEKMLESKKPVEIEVLYKEFEEDITRLDKILRDRRNINSQKIPG